MGEILPDGSIQGYTGKCEQCGKLISVNIQGDSLDNHQCVATLSNSVEKLAEEAKEDFIKPLGHDNHIEPCPFCGGEEGEQVFLGRVNPDHF